MVKENGLTGITPLPKDGIVPASVRMRTETGTHTYATNVHAGTLPAGAGGDGAPRRRSGVHRPRLT
jgi:hypothetical protein